MNRGKSPKHIDALAAEWVLRKDTGLSAAEEADLIAWRSADPRHAESFVRLHSAWVSAGRPRRTGDIAALERRMAIHRRRRQWRRLAAASTLTVLAIGVVSLWRAPEPPPVVVSPRTVAELLVPRSQVLPDGSVIDYQPGTQIRLDFTSAWRRVTLARGEAHFSVVKDPRRQFIVSAGGVEFRAVGTAFNVELGDSSAQLTVAEGVVAVEVGGASVLLDGGGASPVGHVTAGNRVTVALQASVPRATEIAALSETELDELLAWRKPRVEFSSARLTEVVELLNRRNAKQLVIADSSLAEVELSGVFRANDLDSLVRSLEEGFGITAENSGGAIHLRRAR